MNTDGGGVRSYSSLIIIKALMDEIHIKLSQSEGKRPSPPTEIIMSDSRKENL